MNFTPERGKGYQGRKKPLLHTSFAEGYEGRPSLRRGSIEVKPEASFSGKRRELQGGRERQFDCGRTAAYF